MVVKDRFQVPAKLSEVWKLFSDVPSLVSLLPGCTEVQQLSDKRYRARVVQRIKFMKLQFMVEGEMLEQREEKFMRAKMNGRPLSLPGQFNTTLSVDLAATSSGETSVQYVMDSSMEGKLAGLGDMVMRGVVEDTARQFSRNIIRRFERAAAT